jgi:hypothetical protein
MFSMPTRHIRILLPDYVTGRLSTIEREQVEWHLRACERCREDESLLRTGIGASRMDAPGAPETYFPNLLPRIRDRIAARGTSLPHLLPMLVRLLLPLTASAAVVLILILAPEVRRAEGEMARDLTPMVAELSPDEVLDVLTILDSIPFASRTHLSAVRILERGWQDSGLQGDGIPLGAIADSDVDPGDASWTDGLSDDGSDILVKALDERTL